MNIHDILRERILVLDGAMGTVLQNEQLTADDFGGLHYEGCNEYLNLTRPDVVQSIHTAYLEAGADIILTNTFGGTRIVLVEYDLQDQVHAINAAAARLAREVAAAYSTDAKPRFVAGSLGPQTKTISVTGGITFDEVLAAVFTQRLWLLDGGGQLSAEFRGPRRRRALPRNAHVPGHPARALYRQRLAEHRWRVLWDDPRAHSVPG